MAHPVSLAGTKLGAYMIRWDQSMGEHASYYRYWGKARPTEGSGPAFHLLPYHCLDVAAVGVEYLRRAPSLRNLLAQSLRIEADAELEAWVACWLALHDLGKFSEAFQSQRPDLFEILRARPPHPAKSYRVRHDSLGMMFWKQVLYEHVESKEWFGPDTRSYESGLDYWLRAVTGHHGQPPEEKDDYWEMHFDPRADREAIARFAADVRSELFSNACGTVPLALDAESFYQVSKELSWWIAGLTVLADWIGSNTDFFPYRADPDRPMGLTDYFALAGEQAVMALDATDVLPVRSERPLGFAEMYPYIAHPSPLQNWALTVDLPPGAQIHMLEDVTGAGKTEAAVTLAHRLMAAGNADGFFIALPTMATANAMYARIAGVYDKLFAARASLALAHGQRNLVERFAESVVPHGAQENDARQADATATARCAAWLADHNKRALLAPAGVGTIDQALLAVLHSKHQSLRLLGLLRKVLVIDEVHACDAYMQGVLEILLEFHARVGGSVILLSATLPLRTKRALLNAFARGRKLPAPPPKAQHFPLVTSWHTTRADVLVESDLPTRDDVRRELEVHYVSDEEQVVAAIHAALRDGKCVCWMRNTVADALDAYERFKDALVPESLTLFHARFALHDRLRTEGKILTLFGKRSTPMRRRGRLVIATQVAEQSLDADWDFVVTDLAPVDRVIQRAGRLQRHPRDATGRRLRDPAESDRRGKPCLWVYGPEWSADPPGDWFKKAFPKAAGVYPNHGQIWLTASILRKGRIRMPDDARHLIESVFGEEVSIPAGLESGSNAAEGADYGNASVAQQNTVKLATGYVRGGIDWWSEAKTPSRLGEASIDVRLARWDGDRLQPWVEHEKEHTAWAFSTVRVAERLIAKTCVPNSALRQAALERQLEKMPGKGQWSVTLALDETADGWVGEAWCKPRPDKSEHTLTWIYDPQTGLRQLQRSAEEEE
jgi:CRISPR-associated endonuclease/helicase Cas3